MKTINKLSPIIDDELADRCVYGREFVKQLLYSNGYQSLYVPKQNYAMSTKKVQGLKRLGKYRTYYQENPVKFVYDFFQIQLLDSQAYLFMSAWTAREALILGSRAYGKSFWAMLFVMTKQMLSCDPWKCFIAGGSSQQSSTTFQKAQDIANDRVTSLINSNGKIFKDEVVVNAATGDGFSHNPAGFEYTLFNGSNSRSLNSSVDKNRGFRASCVVYDEVSWLSSELIQVYRQFCNVDKDFKTGVGDDGKPIDIVRLFSYPREVPNQLIYVSSASSTDTEFYRMYREYSKRMIMGDRDYFVADIDCELVMKPTIANRPVKAALTRKQVESTMAVSPEKGRRELYNEFTTEAGVNAIIKRGAITRNEEMRVPLMSNDTGDKKFIISWDPATRFDNSIVEVFQIYEDKLPSGDIDIKAKFENCINLIDLGKQRKTPMEIPDQVNEVRKLILRYNGGADGYGNILGVYADAGAAGNASSISSLLMQDFVAPDGNTYPGLIDTKYSPDMVGRFPNAIQNKLHFEEPSGMKSIMYEDMILMINQNKIGFTAEYDNKDSLTVFDVDDRKMSQLKKDLAKKFQKQGLHGEELTSKVNEELSNSELISTKTIALSLDEKLALAQIDATKQEIVNMVRIPRATGKDGFELTTEKRNRMHDDRSYACALASYGLVCERKKQLINRQPQEDSKSLVEKMIIRRGSYNGRSI